MDHWGKMRASNLQQERADEHVPAADEKVEQVSAIIITNTVAVSPRQWQLSSVVQQTRMSRTALSLATAAVTRTMVAQRPGLSMSAWMCAARGHHVPPLVRNILCTRCLQHAIKDANKSIGSACVPLGT